MHDLKKTTFYRPNKQYCKDWYIAFIIGKLNPKQVPKIFGGGGGAFFNSLNKKIA